MRILLFGLVLSLSAIPGLSQQLVLEAETVDDPFQARPTQPRSPAASFNFGVFSIVQVNVDALGQNILGDAGNETSIAVNPTNPNNLAIGWRQFDNVTSNFRQAGRAYSMDGGQTWTFPGSLTPGLFRSDPVLAYDLGGNLYYQSLQSSFDMDVFKSVDGGVTWSSPVASFGGDKNWLAVDISGGPGDGNVYGVWQRFFGCCGTQTFTRSVNAATFFETPVDVERFPLFGTMTVGPEGNVYVSGVDGVSGQDLATPVVATSVNAQLAAETPSFSGVEVDLGGSLSTADGPNPAGLLGQVNVAVDPSDGPFRGDIYVLASVDPVGDPDPLDVRIARSRDGGLSWSDSTRVHGTQRGWQWFGAHSVAPNSRVDVIWNDTSVSNQENLSQLYYAYSYSGGRNWSKSIPVTPMFDSFLGWPNQNKLGDYYTIVSDETGANVAFAATFNGEQDVYFVRVFPDCNQSGVSDVVEIAAGATDCNGNRIPDICEPNPDCGVAGTVPDGTVAGEGPAMLAERSAGGVTLSWGGSCYLGDSDYAVYEGALGDFTSHVPAVCSTAGQTTFEVATSPGDRYYLVVGRNDVAEGSYGNDSLGSERGQGLAACVPQQAGGCE